MNQLTNFDAKAFIEDTWQQRPAVFRQVFPKFVDPISPDELAGIAMEDGVDSRIVSCNRGRWQVQHGPFQSFEHLNESHWSLLVQAVNEHFPPARALLQQFFFLPAWRIDDLMVSYSVPKGGVGAHLDQYDVFIIQGQGQRRWQVGLPGEFETYLPHPELKQIRGFSAVIDEVLEPGDMLYIPANHPHAGESLTASLNYSVGFRAPSQSELLSSLADLAIDQNLLGQRYRDSAASLQSQAKVAPWHLTDTSIDGFRKLLQDALADPTIIRRLCATSLSQNPRPPLQFWPNKPFTEASLTLWLNQVTELVTVPGLRLLTVDEPHGVIAYVQGQRFETDTDTLTLIDHLIRQSENVSAQVVGSLSQSSEAARTLTLWLVNEGFLVENEESIEAED
ncbi:MAG: cupin domain-containing protein [Idiomarina sp.]|nr:cupin domain-containing protein [Idiomarina sp.]